MFEVHYKIVWLATKSIEHSNTTWVVLGPSLCRRKAKREFGWELGSTLNDTLETLHIWEKASFSSVNLTIMKMLLLLLFFFKGSLVIFQSQNGESLDVWCQFILASCRALLWVILFINPWPLPHKKCFLPLTERLGMSHLRPSTQWISTRAFLTCYLIRTDLLHPKSLIRSGKMYPNCNTNYKIIS